MKYILLQQRANDRIFFFTDESTEKSILKYHKFIDFLSPFTIIEREEFIRAINKFDIVFLNLEDGSWEVRKKLNECAINTFEEMCMSPDVIINSTNNEYKESTDAKNKYKNPMDLLADKAKEYINSLYVRNRENAPVYFRRKR